MHTFYRDDCRVSEAAPSAERQVLAFVCDLFATEAEIFLHDWDVLGMDERIPWRAAQLLKWWFLDDTYGRPELETLHEFRRLTLQAGDDAVLKYWAVMSVHFMSRAFFANVRPLAERFGESRAARERLIYFEGIHHLLYEERTPHWQEPPHPTSLAHVLISDAQRRAALHMMDTFAAYGRRQFDRLVRALTTDRERFTFLAD